MGRPQLRWESLAHREEHMLKMPSLGAPAPAPGHTAQRGEQDSRNTT